MRSTTGRRASRATVLPSSQGDKIVFEPKCAGDGKHYTLHAGPDAGVTDVHETTSDSAVREQHPTLFALRKGAFLPVLQELSPMAPELFGHG